MKTKQAILSRNIFWLLLSLPGLLITIFYILGRSTYDSMMHTTGEFGGRFLIIALIASPIAILFPKLKLGKWLVRNRRYFGVAAFLYTLAHVITYLFEETFHTVTNEFFEIGIITGWIAFFIFIPLAATSTNTAVKRMGKNWKKLQRLVYIAAIMTLAHWAFIHYHWKPALVHFAPVIILQIARIIKVRNYTKSA